MRRWLPLLAVCLGTFMLLVDVSIVNIALPDMAHDLSTTFESLQWVIDVYALALAALMLGAGSIADRAGHRRTYVIGLFVFACASLLCGLSPGIGWLLAARGVQGIGAAAMFAVNLTLLNATYQGRERGLAYGVWAAVNGAASAIGPMLGGLLTQYLSWRWIFLVNLPVSVLAIGLSLLVFRRDKSTKRAPVDVPGIVLFTIAASAVTFGLVRANASGWLSADTLLPLGVGAATAVLFAVVERNRRMPMLDPALLRLPSFSSALVGLLMLPIGAFTYLVYVSIWLQSVLSLTPLRAGGVTLAMSAGSILVSLTIGRLLHGRARIWGMTGGLVLIGSGDLLQSTVNAGSSWTAVVPGLALTGLGVGMAAPTLVSAAMSAAPPARAGMASGVVNTVGQLGFAIGVAVFGTVLVSRMESVLSGYEVVTAPAATAQDLAGGRAEAVVGAAPAAAQSSLTTAIRDAFASGLTTVYLIAGGLALLGAAVVGLARWRTADRVLDHESTSASAAV